MRSSRKRSQGKARKANAKSQPCHPSSEESVGETSPVLASKDIEGALLLYSTALDSYKNDDHEAATSKLEKALMMVQGPEPEAVHLACNVRYFMSETGIALADLQDRDLFDWELDKYISMLVKSYNASLSVRESVKFCERIAMLCLKRMEDPSMYGSERLFNQSVATIMDAEADEIEHYKALCSQ